MVLPLMETLVSSANRIESNVSDTLGRLLMQIKDTSRPKSDPCGTQQVTVLEDDLQLFIVTNCCLSINVKVFSRTSYKYSFFQKYAGLNNIKGFTEI